MAAANELLPSTSFNDGSYDDYDNPPMRSPTGQPQGVYDFLPEGPKCKCCPYGYHVDVGFVQYAEEAKRGKYLRHLEQIQRYKKKLRQTMEVFYKQHGRYPPMLNPPDLIKGSEADSDSFSGSLAGEEAAADEDTFAVFGTTEHHSSAKAAKAEASVSQNNSSSSFVSASAQQHDCPECHRAAAVVVPQADCAQCSSASLTTFLESADTVQITREQLTKIRQQMASSLARLRELEALVKNQPVLEARLKVLLEEKDVLRAHLEEKEREASEFRLRFEESVTEVRTLESLRAKDEVQFSQKLTSVEQRIPKPVSRRDQGVGSGDVREVYFLQPLQVRSYRTDCVFDLPDNVLGTLRARWEAEFRRQEAERAPVMRSVGVSMAPATNTVSVDAKPAVQRADVWQSVDMDDEEWHSKEMHFSGGADVLSWFQQQVSTSRDHRTIIQALRRAHQFNHADFKALIVRLLAKNLRSQAVQAKPSTRSSSAMTEEAPACHQAVGDDSVNVEVRPWVESFSVGVGVRPATVSKIASTERVFRYDAATNTQAPCMSEACTLTAPAVASVFNSSVQTEAARSREQGVLTEHVDIVDRRRLESAAMNTERAAASHVATATELVNRMERSMATEERRLYQTSVCTEPVRTSNKVVSVDLCPPPESNSDPSGDSEQVKTETWEEVTVFDLDGRVVRSSADCRHDAEASRALSARSSARSAARSASSSRAAQRSRSQGGESAQSSRSQGSIEFGGGTVRPERAALGEGSAGAGAGAFSGSASGSGSASLTEAGFARSRIPHTVEKRESEEAASHSSSSSHEVVTSSVRSSRSKTDVKSSDLYIACQTFARWMNDSTTTTSKQMNEAEASIRQFWFRLVGSRMSRHDAVEPYLAAIRDLGVSVLSKVVNMVDDTRNSGLHYAVSNANWPLVQLLLDACPVQVDRLNKAGYSVLMQAALCPVGSGQAAPLRQLVRASENVDLRSSAGAQQSALMLAAAHGCVPLLEALLAAGAAPNLQDKDGSTALMCASEHGQTEAVRALLARPETDCNIKDNEGLTALSIAMDNNHRDISLLIYARENLGKATAAKGKNPISHRRHVHISDNPTTYKFK